MQIIVGLGNPGLKYKYTRHNVGFMAVEAIAEGHNLAWQFSKKFNADIIKIKNTEYPIEHSASEVTILVKPQIYMNNSGQAVQAILSYYKLLPKKFGVIQKKDTDLSNILTVIHDDFDIELSKYKISAGSRSAGHKGVQSIIDHLKTKNLKRIRIGIKTDQTNKMPVEKFVLQKFNDEEKKTIDNLINQLITVLKS